jgi:Plasmid encoded RepA protein
MAALPASAKANLEFAAVAYEQEVREAVEAGALDFYARLFVQAGMPHTEPATSQHVCSNGALTLTMMAPPVVGLPYGSLPRLLLSWVTTEAVRHKQRRLVLGNTLRAFMGQLGLNFSREPLLDPGPYGPRVQVADRSTATAVPSRRGRMRFW